MKKGWETKKLVEVCEIIMGTSPPGDTYNTSGQGMPLINGPVEFSPGSFGLTIRSKFTTAPNKLCQTNDLILCVRGSTTGKMNIAAFDACIGRGVAAIRAKVFQPWVNHFISSKTQDIYDLGTGSTFPNIATSALSALAINMPPLAEQQRIVGVLDEAFAGLATARANAEKNLQNGRALFESHLQSVFTRRGNGWVETTLDKLSTNLDSKRVPITKNVRESGEYPYYGASGIVDYVADYIFEGDTLLVSEDGANLLARSTPIAFSVTGKYWVNNHAHILKFENMATQRFVEFYLEGIKLDEYITGAAQPKLNQRALNSIPIPIPENIDEQAKIVGSLDALATETQRLEGIYQQKQMALSALKKSLLHQAFTGEL
ncbi:MAG: restriction endonuclease subunit S [Cryobacterium sp.]|nr:restriction endonuclease subunit S [Cryobacterium sp.]